MCFNPRTHSGCDTSQEKANDVINVSIHAPTRGATSGAHRLVYVSSVSIHAPTRGATNTYIFKCSGILFQSTHPLGVRQQLFNMVVPSASVSIHAPTRGATFH